MLVDTALQFAYKADLLATAVDHLEGFRHLANLHCIDDLCHF